MIRTLPVGPDEERVETGAVKFGDDWPGLFVRGDDAFQLAQAIKDVLADPRCVIHVQLLYAKGFLRSIVRTIEEEVIVKPKEKADDGA